MFWMCLALEVSLTIVGSNANAMFPSFHTDSEASDEVRFADASNAFAIRLYRLLASTESNIFFCPACLSSSLALLAEGSMGKTEVELNETLGFKANHLGRDVVQSLYSKLTERLKMENFLPQSANGIFIQKEYLQSPFSDGSFREVYNTEVFAADFLGNPQQTAWDINEFVRTRTRGQVKRLLDRVDPSDKILLLNASNFKSGGTKNASGIVFSTNRETFYNHGVEDRDVEVPMIQRSAKMMIAESYDFRALELPCEQKTASDFKLWIFLPHKMGTVVDVEDGLSTATFRQIKEAFRELWIDISIPRIKFDFAKAFTKELHRLGIRQAFLPEKADFTRISKAKGLHLSQILHKSAIDINEDWFEAERQNPLPVASEVENLTAPTADTPPFRANHPFLFCIVDVLSGVILYMGRLLEL